jgi:serine/threonine-protein kinase
MVDVLDRLKAALADRYAIERELGRGGMATVYLVRDLKHDCHVALKVLHPELAATLGTERFLREIRIAANLNHTHILRLLDSGEVGGFLYYVMPYVEGETLRGPMNRRRRLPVDEVLRIVDQVVSALAHAHRHHIVHLDVKPENVLLTEGNALVADFGIGKAVCDVCEHGDIKVAETVAGTPAYMSPEQAMAESVDERSDVYGLACVVYEMLTGEPPFKGKSAQATLVLHTVATIPSVRATIPELPAHLDEALQKAMAKSPADRFGNVTEFAGALGLESATAVAAVPEQGSGQCRDCGCTVPPGVELCEHCRLEAPGGA